MPTINIELMSQYEFFVIIVTSQEMDFNEQFLANADGDLEDIVPIVSGEASKKKFRWCIKLGT